MILLKKITEFIQKYKKEEELFRIIILIILNIVIYRYLYTYLTEMIEYYSQDLLCTNLIYQNPKTFLSLDEKKFIFFNELMKSKIIIDQSVVDQVSIILEPFKSKSEVLYYSKDFIKNFPLSLEDLPDKLMIEKKEISKEEILVLSITFFCVGGLHVMYWYLLYTGSIEL